MIKVLFIDDIHPILQQKLETKGLSCDLKSNISNDELKEIIHNYIGLIVRSKKIRKDVLENASKLKFIGRSGAGLENIDVDCIFV